MYICTDILFLFFTLVHIYYRIHFHVQQHIHLDLFALEVFLLPLFKRYELLINIYVEMMMHSFSYVSLIVF